MASVSLADIRISPVQGAIKVPIAGRTISAIDAGATFT